jgi:hypothetical protein
MPPRPSRVGKIFRAGGGGAVLAALCLASATARADPTLTKVQCIEANTRGQDLRRDSKLSGAREMFRSCAAVSCPALVRDDCARRLDEVDKVQPTVVFVTKDPSGKDVTGVKVAVDGKPRADWLDGTELQVDPGEHVFTFTAAGQPPLTVTLVLAAGEKSRREQVVVGARSAVAPPGSAESTSRGNVSQITVASDAQAAISIDGKPVGKGRFDGPEAPGPHEVSVTETGMRPYRAEVDLRDGETRTLDIALEPAHGSALWPWIAGGAALVAGAAVGGYFLLKPHDQNGPAPSGQLGTVYISSFGGR